MKKKIIVKINNSSKIELELDDSNSPNTVKVFLDNLPFTVNLNIWGDEIYTSESPISQEEENAKPVVELYDVAYWPIGKAICLFYGPTPIGEPGKITPASPVNIIGKIISPDKDILENLHGKDAIFMIS